MMFGFDNANKTKAWKKLESEYKRIKKTQMRELLPKTPKERKNIPFNLMT